MAPGHNGPHRDLDTPVRNTAHWLTIFLKAFELTPAPGLRNGAERAARYLLGPEARPMQAAFWCRKTVTKNWSNGLIGQAWVIEALCHATRVLGDERYAAVAREVFLQHAFDESAGLWRVLNVEGSHGRLEYTFNQQLWFAAAGAMLRVHSPAPQQASIDHLIGVFLRHLPAHLDVHPSGLIFHMILSGPPWRRRRERMRKALRGMLGEFHHQEWSYHAFSLYGFALLKHYHGGAVEQAGGARLRRALALLLRPVFRRRVQDDPFAFHYNPTGFEVAFVLLSFAAALPGRDVAGAARYWVREQIRRHFSPAERLMNRKTEDPDVLAARFYEALRLPDMTLDG